jgi:hypothetical protein
MAWCEANRVHFLFGLRQNSRLNAEIARELDRAEAKNRRTGKPARFFKDFMWVTVRESWSRRRRVVARPSSPRMAPIPASSSPPSSGSSARQGFSTRSSIALAVRWRTASRSASLICMQIALRPPPCEQTSYACGLPRSLTCCSVAYAGSHYITPIRQCDLRHHPSPATQDRRTRADQDGARARRKAHPSFKKIARPAINLRHIHRE